MNRSLTCAVLCLSLSLSLGCDPPQDQPPEDQWIIAGNPSVFAIASGEGVDFITASLELAGIAVAEPSRCLTFLEDEYDFGFISPPDVAEASATLKNCGEEALVIERIETTEGSRFSAELAGHTTPFSLAPTMVADPMRSRTLGMSPSAKPTQLCRRGGSDTSAPPWPGG